MLGRSLRHQRLTIKRKLDRELQGELEGKLERDLERECVRETQKGILKMKLIPEEELDRENSRKRVKKSSIFRIP